MKYKYLLFDLDGTLTNPKVGITKSVQYALAKFNIVESNLDTLEKFIGPPLKDSFMNYYAFSQNQAAEAIKIYREYFEDIGLYENKMYSGMDELLGELKQRNIVLCVATSKPTVFAKRIIKHFNLDKYFSIIVGSNLDGTRVQKSEIISWVINKMEIKNRNEVLMIGDRKYDIVGAKSCYLDSVGVLYGFGSKDELLESNPTYMANNILDLRELLLDICI